MKKTFMNPTLTVCVCVCVSAAGHQVHRPDSDVASLHRQRGERKVSCRVSVLQRASLRGQGRRRWVCPPIRMHEPIRLFGPHLCLLPCEQWVWRTSSVMWKSYSAAWSSPGESSVSSTTPRSKTSSAGTNLASTSCRRTHESLRCSRTPRWWRHRCGEGKRWYTGRTCGLTELV